MTDPTRRGDWMQTFTGRAFWPLDPRPEEIDRADIAHALSLLCRYGGHVRRFYSVAEHCVLMSRVVAPEYALWALLHDAAEAYMVDLPRPLKRQFPDYRAAEDNLMAYICKRFDLPVMCPPEVKDADNRILLDERGALMNGALHWGSLDGMAPLGVPITGWYPPDAELAYLERLSELTAND